MLFAPEQLTNPRSIGSFWAPLDIGVTLVISSDAPYIGTGANFAGQEIGTEIKFWSMDLASLNGVVGTTIRLYGISGVAFPDDSAYGCGNGGYQEFFVSLHAGETKECSLTIDDTP